MTADDAGVGQAAGLRVVRGTPDEAELAALVAAAAAMASSAEDLEDPASPRSAWMDRSRTLRGHHGPLPLGRGDGAWRHSLR
ncbi:acyl-CoA carboxylase epsilon subunit [Demequina gelatinilytica]|uniref:acyl-CoA carboxylase epsilon subunit n=1 Tax=Demequina gelatinilytica TaxID=1638980 RepID=UPI000AED5918|nr:acyl-CoA carboxylase epsilon subunit [Demequina gelatinilytica]